MTEPIEILIHGTPWKYSHVKDEIDYARSVSWHKETYLARDALVDKQSKVCVPYSGRKFDAQHFQVVTKGWLHDHCEICTWTLRESQEPDEGIGYTDGQGNWLCVECFSQFIEAKASLL